MSVPAGTLQAREPRSRPNENSPDMFLQEQMTRGAFDLSEDLGRQRLRPSPHEYARAIGVFVQEDIESFVGLSPRLESEMESLQKCVRIAEVFLQEHCGKLGATADSAGWQWRAVCMLCST